MKSTQQFDTIKQEIEAFLHEYYRGFALDDLARMEAGMTEDFTAIFIIPSQSSEPLAFDKKAIMDGYAQAFSLYRGRAPTMRISNIVVIPRSEYEALASYTMDFSLEGRWRNDALAIADLRRESGQWKISRLYETKRR
ncbi:MAG: nuclear transport factor 2 family protein [Candidatus Bipolaricaulota bacterium]|nr:nuclear transport factor 2 family protein [Candidatus Bipolaricaulota bacterium]